MIVAQHAVVHGLGLENINGNNTTQYNCIWFVATSFLAISVNCFFWISGCFRIKFRWNRILELISEAIVYIGLLNIVLIFLGEQSFSMMTIVKIVKRMVFFWESYWFLTAYLLVSLLSPYLNKLVDTLENKERKKLMAELFVLFSIGGFIFKIEGLRNAYTLWQGVYMYMLGAMYDINDSRARDNKTKSIIYFVAILTINGLLSWSFYSFDRGDLAWKMFAYNNPLMIIMSVTLCDLVMSRDNIKISFNSIGTHSLAVYLLTDYPLIRAVVFSPILYLFGLYNDGYVLCIIVLYSIMLTLICAGIDDVRKLIFDKAVTRICK